MDDDVVFLRSDEDYSPPQTSLYSGLDSSFGKVGIGKWFMGIRENSSVIITSSGFSSKNFSEKITSIPKIYEHINEKCNFRREEVLPLVKKMMYTPFSSREFVIIEDVHSEMSIHNFRGIYVSFRVYTSSYSKSGCFGKRKAERMINVFIYQKDGRYDSTGIVECD